MAFISGNLCYQIEHHLYPDLPSNRYAAIAARVQAVCTTYDLPYTTGPLARQYLLTLRTIFKLALPDRFLGATLATDRDTHRCGGGLVTGASISSVRTARSRAFPELTSPPSFWHFDSEMLAGQEIRHVVRPDPQRTHGRAH